MKKLIIGLVIGFLLGSVVMVLADAGDRSLEHVLNRVWNTTANTLTIIGV